MSTLRITTLATQDGTYSVPSETLSRAACRAWVNFNGTGTVAIRASYNVSSITDNDTGDYTVNFTNALADANYNFVCSGRQALVANNNDYAYGLQESFTPTTTALRVTVQLTAGTGRADSDTVCVSIFR